MGEKRRKGEGGKGGLIMLWYQRKANLRKDHPILKLIEIVLSTFGIGMTHRELGSYSELVTKPLIM